MSAWDLTWEKVLQIAAVSSSVQQREGKAEPTDERCSKDWPRAAASPRAGVSMGEEGLAGPCSPVQLLDTSKVWAGNSQISRFE